MVYNKEEASLPLFLLGKGNKVFKSKRKTYVGTSITNVLEKDNIPNSAKTAIAESVINGSSISSSIVNEIVSGLSVKGGSYYRYGKKHLPYGLPTRAVYAENTIYDDIAPVLIEKFGGSINIEYAHFGAPNYFHLAYETLTKSFQYNFNSNVIEGIARNAYLRGMTILVPEHLAEEIDPDSFVMLSRSPSAGFSPVDNKNSFGSRIIKNEPYVVTNRVSEICAEMEYIITRVSGGLGGRSTIRYNTYKTVIQLPQLEDHKEYLFTQFQKDGLEVFYHYEMDSGTEEAIERILNNPNKYRTGDFFPFAYFRYGKRSASSLKGTEEYNATRKMLKKISMDYEEVIDQINSNPEIADVEQAMLIWAVNGTPDTKEELEYLFYFFDSMSESDTNGLGTNSRELNVIQQMFRSLAARSQSTAIEIRDRKFRMVLGHNGITYRYVQGRIGSTGFVKYSTGNTYEYFRYTDSSDRERRRTVVTKNHYYSMQISQNMYKEIRVRNLGTKYYIYGSHHTTGYDESDLLMIPIDHSLMNRFSAIKKEKLYGSSLKFVFNSRVTQKVKWYQRGIFKTFVSVIAIALVVYTAGSSLMALASAVASGAMTLSAMFLALLKKVLVGVLVSFGTKILADNLGVEFTVLAAVLLASYGIYDWASSGGLDNAPWASDLLNTSTGILKTTQTHISQEFQAMLDEFSSHFYQMEDAWEDLKRANDSLKSSSVLTPFTFLGESPQDYYNRTIYSGNVGVLALDVIPNFYETHLRLPSAQETIGEMHV